MGLSARMPELSALEVLSAIAKTGSLSAASREVGISQQAVSARLTSIEAQVGVRLVTRTTRGTQLTPAGEVVAEWADQVLDVAQRVDTGLASLRAERRSRLKVAASQTVAEQLLPRWLVSFQAAALRHGSNAPEVSFNATDSTGAIAALRTEHRPLRDLPDIAATEGCSGRDTDVPGRNHEFDVVAAGPDVRDRERPKDRYGSQRRLLR